MIKNKANVTIAAKNGTTLLHLATEKGSYKTNRSEIEHGQCTNNHSFVSNLGNEKLFDFIVERGVDVDAKDGKWNTALFIATKGNGKITFISWICVFNSSNHVADNGKFVEKLINSGADVNATNQGMNTALHKVAENGIQSSQLKSTKNNWTESFVSILYRK